MKIANCKCGGGQPVILKNGEYNCERCGRYTFSLFSWNSLNTDQHGQQIKRQIIEWVEWDGDVEHLPKEGSAVHVLLNPSIVSGWIKLVTKENKVSAFIANNGLRGDIDLRKGDMFAVVE